MSFLPFLFPLFLKHYFLGRMLTFLARIVHGNMNFNLNPAPNANETRVIGIDEQTAFLVNHTTGVAKVVGFGTAYICYRNWMPEVCQSNTPLTFQSKYIYINISI